MQTIETEYLKPCPFCNGKAEFRTVECGDIIVTEAICTECYSRGQAFSSFKSYIKKGKQNHEDAIKKAADSWNNREYKSPEMMKLEAAREHYVSSLSVAEVAPMMEAVKLFEYADFAEAIFCMNMAKLYGCVPLKSDGNNLNDFLVTLYHYGKVQGIREERAKKKGGNAKCTIH